MSSRTPKKTQRSKGTAYEPGIFAEAFTVKDFAAILGVPEKALPLIKPLPTQCRSSDCRGSDVMMTDHSKILQIIPFGHTGKMDKGFTVDNIAAAEGVIVDRPAVRKRNQKQQSAIDTAQTQKIGNTRIIIENVNGGVKMDIRYLNALIPCTQFGIISKIVRIGFLLQNFKPPIIQNRNPDSVSDMQEGRPCRAEIRWHGATDAGLSDCRGCIQLWGLQCEKDRHAQLSAMEEHKDKSVVEISEMVLSERWELKMREELYQMHGRVYDGEKFNQELYESHSMG